jgi:hypothetical protein
MKWFVWLVAMLMVMATMAGAMAENETNNSDTIVVVITGDDDSSDGNETGDNLGDVDENETNEVDLQDEDGNESDGVVVILGGDENESNADDNETDSNETGAEENGEVPEELEGEFEEASAEAGITPDQPILWGLERAIERISLALTFNKSAKAKKGLAHARERLMEVKAMIMQKRFGAAEAAQEEYENLMDEVQDNVGAMGDGGEEDLAEQAEIEAEIEEQQQELGNLNRIKLKLKNLSESQQNRIREMVQSLNLTTSNINSAVQGKIQKAKIKIKAKTGMTDEEVDALANQIKGVLEQGISKETSKQIRNVIRETMQNKNKNRVTGDDADDDDSDDDSDNESANAAGNNRNKNLNKTNNGRGRDK